MTSGRLFRYCVTEAGNWEPKPTFGICTWASPRRLNKINQNKAILQMLNFWSRCEWPQRLICRHLWMFWFLLLAQSRIFEKFRFFSFGRESSIILTLLAQARFSSFLVLRSLELLIEPMISIANDNFFRVNLCTLFLGRGWAAKILFWIEKEGWIGCITYHYHHSSTHQCSYCQKFTTAHI